LGVVGFNPGVKPRGSRLDRLYNTIGTQRVVLSVPGGRFDELAFSTGDPEAVLAVVEHHAGG
jgi:hypothetical protein